MDITPVLADADAAYRVLLARDARFDGRMFVGVTSTGVYCRPICRVRTPKAGNCRFFASAMQAESNGFRPCLKCRPEISPRDAMAWSVMDASHTLAHQAARLLDEALTDAVDSALLASIAERLGVSDRHLRRIFAAAHGVTPMQYVQTRRLLMAKHLLTDSTISVSQVALASGFRSLRRFNDAFANAYRMSPSRLRRDAGDDAAAAPDHVRLVLGYRQPYDIARLLNFVDKRAITHVERVGDLCIRRSVRAGVLAPTAGWIEAVFKPERAQVVLSFDARWAAHSAAVLASARRWLDLDAAPEAIDTALRALPGSPGVRLPGSLDAFELAVRAVLGQQVTVAAARTLASRLVLRFGETVVTPWADAVDRSFPSDRVLAKASIEDIASLGIVRQRSTAIIELARAWPRLAPLVRLGEPMQPLVDALCALPGIGVWTAEYIAMRALGWPDAFPHGDVALVKAMGALFGVRTACEARAHAEAFAPWRSYAVLRLWDSLSAPSSHPSDPASPTERPLPRWGRAGVGAAAARVPKEIR